MHGCMALCIDDSEGKLVTTDRVYEWISDTGVFVDGSVVRRSETAIEESKNGTARGIGKKQLCQHSCEREGTLEATTALCATTMIELTYLCNPALARTLEMNRCRTIIMLHHGSSSVFTDVARSSEHGIRHGIITSISYSYSKFTTRPCAKEIIFIFATEQ